jgi:alpha-ribazole phosphatase
MKEIKSDSFRNLYLLRHGDTRTDSVKRYIGRTDIFLNEKGREQARWWKKRLSDVPLSRIICSDLTRTSETAGIIAEERSIHIDLCSELREIDLGEWDGLAVDEIKSRFPVEYEKRGVNPAGFRPEGGESFFDVSCRVVPVIEQIAKSIDDGNILIVSHAGVNRVILCYLLEMPLSNLFRLGQDFACLNIISYEKDSVQIRAINLHPDNLEKG